jgi:hypothetical protein
VFTSNRITHGLAQASRCCGVERCRVHAKKDKDLDALRDREDFKKLIAELETKVAGAKKKN